MTPYEIILNEWEIYFLREESRKDLEVANYYRSLIVEMGGEPPKLKQRTFDEHIDEKNKNIILEAAISVVDGDVDVTAPIEEREKVIAFAQHIISGKPIQAFSMQ